MSNNGYFSFPNIMIDKLLCLLSGAEYKVLSVVFRQTIGWHKQWDRISITQFQKKCGLSKPCIRSALKVLIGNKLILCREIAEIGRLVQRWYAIYGATNESTEQVNSVDLLERQTGKLILSEWVNSVDLLGEKQVKLVYPQKKGLKETIKETTPTADKNHISNIIPQAVDNPKEGVFDSQKEEKEKVRAASKQVEYLQDMVMEAFHPQLTQKPAYSACRNAVDKYGFDVLEAAVIEARGKALKSPTPAGALNYVIGIARNGQSGLSYDQRSKIATKIKELRTDLMYAEKEIDLDKFQGVVIAGQKVGTKDEFCTVARSEIDRLREVMGG